MLMSRTSILILYELGSFVTVSSVLSTTLGIITVIPKIDSGFYRYLQNTIWASHG